MKSRSDRSSAEPDARAGTAAPVSAYRGRFAPSPTGPLHLGSLIAALGSWLDARREGGEWYVRIEDIDPPREVPGAADAILHSLECHGLHWDGNVLYQSRREARYRAALAELERKSRVFSCGCSRRELGPGGSCGGRCGPLRDGTGVALRLRCTGTRREPFRDLILGEITDAASLPEDFVLWRRDGLPAYQLAVTVDDLEQGINHVLRGSDLLPSTARQLHLVRALGGCAPAYGHLPLAVDRRGRKLSKQTHAPAIDDGAVVANLSAALSCLGQAPAETASREELLAHAVRRWDRSRVAGASPHAFVAGSGERRLRD